MTKISIIAAMAKNRTIGIENKLPWNIPEDLAYFKKVTMGKPLLMGRKTFESIVEQLGKPLPGRINIVLSERGFKAGNTTVMDNFDKAIHEAKKLAKDAGHDEMLIIGGRQLYEQALRVADRIYLTEVHEEFDGDAWFPDLGPEWKEISREERKDTDPPISFVVLERP
ncbi:MAG: dihydrofolate reductase [Rhodospirillales bacterium]|nr:dihydrofolate reductase [Alphaproteobacteria bacterium]MCB9977014.1 dihydrofolate reductase [Rhodospirillales bacterium]